MNDRSSILCKGVVISGLIGVALLAGCTTYVTSNVTAFQDWQGGDQDRTYAFSRTPAQENDLEQSAYEQLVGRELSTYGFKLTPRAQAHYAVSLTYGQRDTTAYSQQFANYGAYGAYGWGGGWGRGGWGRGGWGPGWGFGPWSGPPPVVDVPYAAFASQLTLRIASMPSGREVYKVMAQTVTDSNALPQIMPYLVRSALSGFPLQNGTTRTVRVMVPKNGAPAGGPGHGANEVVVGASTQVAAPMATPSLPVPASSAAAIK